VILRKKNLFCNFNDYFYKMSKGDFLKDGRYQIFNKLGKGSQGVVYLVDDYETKENYFYSLIIFLILIFNN
jgi:hypothetical protein